MSSGFAHVFGQIVSIRVKLLSSTNVEASGHIKREKASFLSTCVAHKRLCLNSLIERFRSGGQYLCNCIGTEESVNVRKEFSSNRIGLEHQHGCRFIVLAAVTSCKNAL